MYLFFELETTGLPGNYKGIMHVLYGLNNRNLILNSKAVARYQNLNCGNNPLYIRMGVKPKLWGWEVGKVIGNYRSVIFTNHKHDPFASVSA